MEAGWKVEARWRVRVLCFIIFFFIIIIYRGKYDKGGCVGRVYQNTLKFEIQGVHHFSTQEMVPIEATKSFRALSLS